MHLQGEIDRLRLSLAEADRVQTELDRRIFHLKTLYDISKDTYGSVDSGTILRNFLLMTTGNFGMVEGFIAIVNVNKKELVHFVSLGIKGRKLQELHKHCLKLCLNNNFKLTSAVRGDHKEKVRVSDHA